jgi:hypothetical protein
MGIRFRKALKLFPGVKLNLSFSGVSATIGPRGASVNIGPRGTFLNTGIPGTGLYSRERLFQPQRNVRKNLATLAGLDAEDGQSGSALPESIRRYTELSELMEHVHWTTPKTAPTYVPRLFEDPAPDARTPVPIGLLDRLLGRRAEIEKANLTEQASYEEAYRDWLGRKSKHEAEEGDRKDKYGNRIFSSPLDALQVMDAELQRDRWAFPFTVDLKSDAKFAWLYAHVDLPEIEEFPQTQPVIERDKLKWRALTPYQQRERYAQYVHGLMFKIVGLGFACAPAVPWVVAVGYTQRSLLTPTSRYDANIISISAKRTEWGFKDVSQLDAMSELTKFDLRREFGVDMELREVIPHEKPPSSPD